MTSVCDGVRLWRLRIESEVLEAVSEALGDDVENVAGGSSLRSDFGGVMVR
jgi:hypothetical protein